jgi:hypothetical protein
MSNDQEKEILHFNKATVWGRVDGTVEKKLSNEGKGRKKDSADGSSKKGAPFYRLKVICASHRGNAFAYGRIWNEEKVKNLIEHLKKNPGAGIKLVGWFNQYDKTLEGGKIERRSNFTWHDWAPDECLDPRAAFSIVGMVTAMEGDLLSLHLERKGSQGEDFRIHALESVSMERLTVNDIIQVKGYLRSKDGEDEFGDTDNSPILPYFADKDLKVRKEGMPF